MTTKKKKPAKKPAKTPAICIIRTQSAGVHVGTVHSRNGIEVVLHDARRVWRWRGANTLHELSQHGADEEWTRISEPAPAILLTQAIEIITCSAAAAADLTRSRWPA